VSYSTANKIHVNVLKVATDQLLIDVYHCKTVHASRHSMTNQSYIMQFMPVVLVRQTRMQFMTVIAATAYSQVLSSSHPNYVSEKKNMLMTN